MPTFRLSATGIQTYLSYDNVIGACNTMASQPKMSNASTQTPCNVMLSHVSMHGLQLVWQLLGIMYVFRVLHMYDALWSLRVHCDCKTISPGLK